MGHALDRDHLGRILPVWEGCRIVADQEVFLMNWQSENSLDGRYFGPLPASTIVGRADPLWTGGGPLTCVTLQTQRHGAATRAIWRPPPFRPSLLAAVCRWTSRLKAILATLSVQFSWRSCCSACVSAAHAEPSSCQGCRRCGGSNRGLRGRGFAPIRNSTVLDSRCHAGGEPW